MPFLRVLRRATCPTRTRVGLEGGKGPEKELEAGDDVVDCAGDLCRFGDGGGDLCELPLQHFEAGDACAELLVGGSERDGAVLHLFAVESGEFVGEDAEDAVQESPLIGIVELIEEVVAGFKGSLEGVVSGLPDGVRVVMRSGGEGVWLRSASDRGFAGRRSLRWGGGGADGAGGFLGGHGGSQWWEESEL